MRVCVVSLGCKVNQYESHALMFKLRELGHDVTCELGTADAYIINTCAVTNEAERKSRQMIERCKKLNKDAKIYVLGCASEHSSVQFAEKGVTFVQGNAEKMKILEHLESEGEKIFELPKEYEDMGLSVQSTCRAFIKVQDGCDKFCSYCIIPYLRGRSRSRKIESVINEIKQLSDDVKEIVIVGIDVSSYKDGDKTLIDLLEEVDKCGKRWRLSSMEDNIVTEDFVKRLKNCKNFCDHFHLSLQSGSDEVLKKMNRRYTTAEFLDSVSLIRKYFKFAGITTDVIVGFPTETDELFDETVKFIESVGFSDLHIFPYSKRDGTAAAKIYKDLPKEVKMKRLHKLEEIKLDIKTKFIKENSDVSVLIEEINDGIAEGYSKNYIRCYYDGKCNVGDILEGKITKIYQDGVLITTK